ncbi:hypothetical protein AB0L59_37475 [Streptomyces sp. NPDC052109]
MPAIVAGLLIATLGLPDTVLGYGVADIAAATLGLVAQYRMNTRR